MLTPVRRVLLGKKPWKGPASGLTHRWPMTARDVTGVVLDVVGGLHASATGGVANAAGPAAGVTSRSFDGTGYLTLASSPLPDFTSAHSVFGWALVTTIGTSENFIIWSVDGNNGLRILVDNGAGGTHNGTLGVVLKQSGTDKGVNVTTQPFANNTWVHIGYTWDGSATMVIYANAAVQAQGTSAGVGLAVNSFLMGASTTAPGSPVTGRMYQWVTYTRTLSAAEITQLYNAF